ncbi:uncharacterized protein LOC127586910 [Pristis pectinata]|uniref:uncharacterized protein LOC127586910 n=1 Tax=Pristis pectinata TaxID=685728 RepID=UPI00223D20C3|nr:uncharacterized protein LOC127586910 [Pristis pectinata]
MEEGSVVARVGSIEGVSRQVDCVQGVSPALWANDRGSQVDSRSLRSQRHSLGLAFTLPRTPVNTDALPGDPPVNTDALPGTPSSCPSRERQPQRMPLGAAGSENPPGNPGRLPTMLGTLPGHSQLVGRPRRLSPHGLQLIPLPFSFPEPHSFPRSLRRNDDSCYRPHSHCRPVPAAVDLAWSTVHTLGTLVKEGSCTGSSAAGGQWVILPVTSAHLQRQFFPVQFLGDYGKFSYDAVNKRLYSNLLMSRGRKQWQQVNILLFQKSVMYQYFPNNQTCLKSPLGAPFRRFGVPKNATFLAQTYIGVPPFPGTGLLTNGWTGSRDGVSYLMTFMEYKCLPNYQAFISTKGWFSESFYNLTLGIQDPSVFIPPPECGEPIPGTVLPSDQ